MAEDRDAPQEACGDLQTFEKIPDELIPWIEEQPVFFVATAPADPATHVNVSPRGLDNFRVLGPNHVAWLDLTGSGVETVAHLKADGRITLMFCAFDDPPRVVRLYGRGTAREHGDKHHDGLRSRLPDLPGARVAGVLGRPVVDPGALPAVRRGPSYGRDPARDRPRRVLLAATGILGTGMVLYGAVGIGYMSQWGP